MKYFGKNFIFSVKSTNVLFFWDQMYICMQNYSFYPKFVHFSEFFGKNFIFSVKSTILLVFQDQMHIFGYKNKVFIQNLYILVKLFCKNFIFSVKSTIFFIFQDQMYIFGYKISSYPKFVHFSEIFWQKLHF